ncbi:MAG: sigma-54-dependent Fis family transcriptional regulator [Deltaproteobacteria bacterium]|nr:sigma-54-dependent Fis family transcriptional regulator [Deltaproteobacteria bacterium]
MSQVERLPRLLVVDDILGRAVAEGRNEERAAFCASYLLRDITPGSGREGIRVREPIAEAIFCRGQQPTKATVGSVVEDDLPGTLEVVRRGWRDSLSEEPFWSLVLLDLCFYTGRVTEESYRRFPGIPEGRPEDDDPSRYFGFDLLGALHQELPDLPVVILSAQSREEVSRLAFTGGALSFLERGGRDGSERLAEVIWQHGLWPDPSGRIVGKSKTLLLALRAARRVARGRRNVLIRGERGSGKELFAQFIHGIGNRDEDRPLITVDSGALTPTLYASELFGHRRGAFTGADQSRIGRIVEARGGDLFLDEIGNMPADVQAGLLRVIEERTVLPLGGTKPEKVDVRFLSATNEKIETKAGAGTFREDLLDRLREAGTVHLPPLCDRFEDLPGLVEHFVREAEERSPGSCRREIGAEVPELLESYDWPGNVRELRNVVQRAVTEHPDVEHLVSAHLELPKCEDSRPSPRPSELGVEVLLEPPNLPIKGLADFGTLIEFLDSFSFEGMDPRHLAGKLPELEKVYARFIARYLRSVLAATSKSTLDEPEGSVLIHPAMKLATGDRELSGSQAADLIKRLLRRQPDAINELMEDPLLQEAHRRSRRLRPSRRQRHGGSRPL